MDIINGGIMYHILYILLIVVGSTTRETYSSESSALQASITELRKLLEEGVVEWTELKTKAEKLQSEELQKNASTFENEYNAIVATKKILHEKSDKIDALRKETKKFESDGKYTDIPARYKQMNQLIIQVQLIETHLFGLLHSKKDKAGAISSVPDPTNQVQQQKQAAVELVTPVKGASYVICKENDSVFDYVLKKVGYKSESAKKYKTTFYSFDGKPLKEIIEEGIGSEFYGKVCRNPIQHLDPNAPNPQPTTYGFENWVWKGGVPVTMIHFYDKNGNKIASFRYSGHDKPIPEYANWKNWITKEFGKSTYQYTVATDKNLNLSIVKQNTRFQWKTALALTPLIIILSPWLLADTWKQYREGSKQK